MLVDVHGDGNFFLNDFYAVSPDIDCLFPLLGQQLIELLLQLWKLMALEMQLGGV